MDINDLVDKMYGVLPESAVEPVEALVEIGGQSIPVISGAMNWYKFKKINKEIESIKGQVTTIMGKVVSSQNEMFIKREVFPIVLNKILNDEQPMKIGIMFNGFEHIIDENILEIDKIFHFYDVLSELRMSEIVHFTEEYVVPFEENKSGKIKFRGAKLSLHETEEDMERQDLQRYMDNKLLKLGILEYDKEHKFFDYSNPNYEPYRDRKNYEINLEKFVISNFGIRFIEFFYNEEGNV